MNKKNKKIVIIVMTSIISISLIMLIVFNVRIENTEEGNVYNEIIPEEEITDNQLRETTINLYYVGDNNEIKEVLKKVDSKMLIENPYLIVMHQLLEKENLGEYRTCIPENVKVNSVTRKGECLVIDLSKEFIENMEDNSEIQSLSISQIVNTMTQFTEINAIKIFVDGSDDCSFKNGNINFKQFFTDED